MLFTVSGIFHHNYLFLQASAMLFFRIMPNNSLNRKYAKLLYPFLLAFTTFLLIMIVRSIIRKANLGFTWLFDDINSCDMLYLLFAMPPMIVATHKQYREDICNSDIREYINNINYFNTGWNFLSMVCIASIIIYWGFNPYFILATYLYTTGLQNLCITHILLYQPIRKRKITNLICIFLGLAGPWCLFQLIILAPLSSGIIAFILSSLGIFTILITKLILKNRYVQNLNFVKQ